MSEDYEGAREKIERIESERDKLRAEVELLRALCAEMADEEQTLLMAEIIADNIVKQEHHKGALRVLRSLQAQIYADGAKAKT